MDLWAGFGLGDLCCQFGTLGLIEAVGRFTRSGPFTSRLVKHLESRLGETLDVLMYPRSQWSRRISVVNPI